MKIIKPTSLGILTRTYRSAAREHLGIAIPLLATLGDTPRLLGESALWDVVREELGAYTLDAALPKPHGEFLVSARAYGKYCGAAHACEVGARFAGIEKRLRVTGDRAPFDELPIDWPLTYGGPGFADNPRGRGFAPGPQTTSPSGPPSAPQVAYAAPGPLRPASFAPIAADWPARRTLYGKLDQQWLDEDRPGFPRSLDRRYFNIAPLDQQLSAHLALPNAAAYEFTRLHPEREVLRGVLPALRARCFIKRRESGSLEEIPMRLTTAWFVPHRERVAMIFHGETVIDEFDARDVECLLLAAETCGDTRPAGHYRHVFDLRHDPEHGVLHALRDADLMPESMLSRDDAPQASVSAWQGNLMRRARREAELAGTRVPAVAAAFEGDGFTPPRLSELAEFVARSERQASEQRAALETRRKEVEAKRTALKPLPNARRGPPAVPSAQHVRRCGMPDAGRRLRDVYRHAAHYQDAASSLSTAASQALRARISAGDCIAGFDLTGADLSGMNLRGANLSGALLESADLTGADLSDATLTDAVLVRATLTRTRLSGANLAAANLSLAQCEDTDFTGATLDGCVAERTRFLRCCFRLASIRRAQLRECTFDSADFSNATLADLAFTEQVLSDANFKGATIRKLAFVNCHLERACFSGADVEGFGLVETIARDVDFNMASLKKACFVKDTVLAGADFTQAVLVEVNLREADLRGARFDHASIVQSDFSDANLQAASLLSVRIENGYLVRADLRGAALSRADLINACLRRADLRGADLRETNLFRADLAEASLDRATRLDGAYLEQAVFHPLASARA